MKLSRKLITGILAIVLVIACVGTLAACGESDGGGGNDNPGDITLTSIAIKTPGKTTFDLNAPFSMGSLVIEGVFSDNSRSDLASTLLTIDSSAYVAGTHIRHRCQTQGRHNQDGVL